MSDAPAPEVPTFDRDPDLPTKPIPLSVDGDVFLCAPVLPAGATRDLARLGKANANEQIVLFGDFLDSVMLPESAARFAKRLRDPENPVTDKQVSAIIVYLIQQYGHRPTTPASPSPNGANAGGTNSTAN